MSNKLSPKQRSHLETLNDGHRFRSAYGNGLHIGTLNSLSLRGFVTASRSLGSDFSPRIGIKWKITPAGREALSNKSESDL